MSRTKAAYKSNSIYSVVLDRGNIKSLVHYEAANILFKNSKEKQEARVSGYLIKSQISFDTKITQIMTQLEWDFLKATVVKLQKLCSSRKC